MNGGINQLVDTYKGNPQPLANQVRKAQQGQPPGEIPADLEEALALQEIAKLRQGAQNQQAMQAGGAQPSVVDKLKQMLAGYQAQAQMAPPAQGAPAPQGQPVMAARGGSIDQLMSNLGRHYAGGGIIAFDDGGRGEDKKPLEQYTLQQQGADWVARKEAEREAQIKAALEEEARRQALISQIPTGGQQAPASTGPMPGELQRNVTNTLAALPGASAAKGFAGGIRGLLAALVGMEDRKEKPAPTETKDSATPSPTDPNFRRQTDPRMTGTPATAPDVPLITSGASPAAAPRPSTGGAGAGLAAAVEKLDPNSLRGLTEDYIRGEFKLSPEQERDKAIEFAKKTMGLEGLLGEKERRANAREAAIRNIEAKRTPAWVEGLAGARKSVRGGLGSLIGQMGDTADTARQGYEMQSLAFQKELDQLRDVIVDAKISGNKELVKEGMAAYKEVDARRRAAATNATSLVKTDEDVAMRKQLAKDAAAGRAQSASQHADNKALALEEKKRQFNEEQLRKIREKDVDRAAKIEAAIAKRTGNIDLQLQSSKLKPEVEADLLRRRNAIVKQVQAEYPPIKPEKPSMDQFLTAARQANPGVSDADLKAYYNKTYGS